MVPTLSGRIQTRLFLLALVGGAVTALITPALPLSGPLADRYRATFLILAAVAVLGVGWEFGYHLAMQWRWEKDWPTLLGLLTLLPEAAAVWTVAGRGLIPGLPGPIPAGAFTIHIVTVWVVVWLTANGPMRVPFTRWRFRGGRLL